MTPRSHSMLFGIIGVAMTVASSVIAAQPQAAPPEVFEAEGKRGYRIELWPPSEGNPGRAEVYRPLHSRPARFIVIAEESGPAAERYRLIGQRETHVMMVYRDGRLMLDQTRDLPSRWRLHSNQ
jgi:hypothetical protein